MGQRAGDDKSIPLCEAHHTGLVHQERRFKLSIHGSKHEFVGMYGTEEELLAIIVKLLEQA